MQRLMRTDPTSMTVNGSARDGAVRGALTQTALLHVTYLSYLGVAIQPPSLRVEQNTVCLIRLIDTLNI
jgi:hypothetical protein